jgi:hypothetical protein
MPARSDTDNGPGAQGVGTDKRRKTVIGFEDFQARHGDIRLDRDERNGLNGHQNILDCCARRDGWFAMASHYILQSCKADLGRLRQSSRRHQRLG